MFSYDEVVKINAGFGAHSNDIEFLKNQLKNLENRFEEQQIYLSTLKIKKQD